MTSRTREPISKLQVESAAAWLSRRLCGLIDGNAPSIEAPVSWCLHQWMQGHTCLDFSKSIKARPVDAGSAEELEANIPREWLPILRESPCVGSASVGSMGAMTPPLVLEGEKLFLRRCRDHEVAVAHMLADRAKHNAASCSGADRASDPVDDKSEGRAGLHATQRKAIHVACTHRISLITGGPGTGKTTVAARVIEAMYSRGVRSVLLVAPTGKAAARLQETIRLLARDAGVAESARETLASLEAQTLAGAIVRQRGEAIRRADLVIVDETSMIDLESMHELLKLAKPNASVVMLGDAHQLVSVEAGSVLTDIVPRDTDTNHPLHAVHVALTHNFRFGDTSDVGRLASAVARGAVSEVIELLESGTQSVTWTQVNSSADVVDQSERKRRAFGDHARILCGHRHGPDGSIRMNQVIVGRVAGGSTGHFEGRPILVTVNDPNTGLNNGDTGVMHREVHGWVASFPGHPNPIRAEQLPAHETAYAMTIHKTQGSEYPDVIIALPAAASPVLTRELLYTGITRTKKNLTIVSSRDSLVACITQSLDRASGLRERLVAAALERSLQS